MSTFDIVITPGAEPAAPADGFIDIKSSDSYIKGGGMHATVAKARAKARAFRRYFKLIHQIENMATTSIVSATATGAAIDTAATDLKMRLAFNTSALTTEDENNPGQLLTGAAALKRCVARALILSEDIRMEYFDPTQPSVVQNGVAVAGARIGPRFETQTVGAIAASLTAAEALVTVTLVP